MMSPSATSHEKGAKGRRRSSVRFNLSDTADIAPSPEMDWYPTTGSDWYSLHAASDGGPIDRGPIDGDSDQELRNFTTSDEDADDEEDMNVCTI